MGLELDGEQKSNVLIEKKKRKIVGMSVKDGNLGNLGLC